MNESQLFKRTCLVLASTLILPVAVALFAHGGAEEVKKYVDQGTMTSFVGSKDKKSADKDSKKDQKSTDKKTADKSSDKNSASSAKETETGVKSASTYTVKAGDTYGCIAENYYGSYEQWPTIYNANIGGGVGYGEYDLHVGAVLTLPAVAADQVKPASQLCD